LKETHVHANRRFALALITILLVGCAAPGGPVWTPGPRSSAGNAPSTTTTPAAEPTGAPTATPVSPGQVGGTIGTIEFHSFDLGFEPAQPTVDAPGRYVVSLVNDGAIPHDITFADGTQLVAQAGETVSGEIDVPAEGIDFICSIPGHADAGMSGRVSVAGQAQNPSPDPSAAASHDPNDHGGPAPETDVVADPNAPPPIRMNPEAPALLDGETHDIELVMTERLMTVAEGFQQAVWTFGDTVPGPVIRVKVGDLVRVHLVNPVENQLSHSIDFHASLVAWNDEMRSIAPGEELIYEFTAEYAGVWMYHCGTSPTLHHIANGMYGMIIVEPVGGLEPVDHEFAFVQSEWYLGPQGEPSSLAKAGAAAPAPDFVVFNGVANQYADGPIEVPTGERVRAFVLNAGPSTDSSYHIVGTIFDRVVKEGVELAVGNPGSWGSQAVDLSPAQGALVEFTFAEDGMYPMVTHAFNFVGRGALGLFQAGDGDPAN
jgi:nitrite reductase (NO-forming)